MIDPLAWDLAIAGELRATLTRHIAYPPGMSAMLLRNMAHAMLPMGSGPSFGLVSTSTLPHWVCQ